MVEIVLKSKLVNLSTISLGLWGSSKHRRVSRVDPASTSLPGRDSACLRTHNLFSSVLDCLSIIGARGKHSEWDGYLHEFLTVSHSELWRDWASFELWKVFHWKWMSNRLYLLKATPMCSHLRIILNWCITWESIAENPVVLIPSSTCLVLPDAAGTRNWWAWSSGFGDFVTDEHVVPEVFFLAFINCLCCKCGEEAMSGDKRPASIPLDARR